MISTEHMKLKSAIRGTIKLIIAFSWERALTPSSLFIIAPNKAKSFFIVLLWNEIYKNLKKNNLLSRNWLISWEKRPLLPGSQPLIKPQKITKSFSIVPDLVSVIGNWRLCAARNQNGVTSFVWCVIYFLNSVIFIRFHSFEEWAIALGYVKTQNSQKEHSSSPQGFDPLPTQRVPPLVLFRKSSFGWPILKFF